MTKRQVRSGNRAVTAVTAAAGYERAFRALCENAIEEYDAGVTEETPGSTRLNSAVIDAKRRVPRWRRWFVQRRVVRELDYWNRTDGG